MQISSQYFESSVEPVIKMSSELNYCECPYSKLEICHKSQQVYATQKP